MSGRFWLSVCIVPICVHFFLSILHGPMWPLTEASVTKFRGYVRWFRGHVYLQRNMQWRLCFIQPCQSRPALEDEKRKRHCLHSCCAVILQNPAKHPVIIMQNWGPERAYTAKYYFRVKWPTIRKVVALGVMGVLPPEEYTEGELFVRKMCTKSRIINLWHASSNNPRFAATARILFGRYFVLPLLESVYHVTIFTPMFTSMHWCHKHKLSKILIRGGIFTHFSVPMSPIICVSVSHRLVWLGCHEFT